MENLKEWSIYGPDRMGKMYFLNQAQSVRHPSSLEHDEVSEAALFLFRGFCFMTWHLTKISMSL